MKAHRPCAIVILAAGQGKRMKSDLPKVLHSIGGRAMLDWSIALAGAVHAARTIVVVSPHGAAIREVAEARGAEIAVQEKPMGTGDAVNAARGLLKDFDGDVMVLFADTPLVRPETLKAVLDARANGATLVGLGFEAADPAAYGRLVLSGDGQLDRIVEAKDATQEELAIRLCNSGALAAPARELFQWLSELTPANASGEYYLTDCAALARRDGARTAVVLGEESEFGGVNDRVQLAEIEATFQHRRRVELMKEGVTMVAPETVFLAYDTQIERDVRIEPHVVFGPGVHIARNSVIRSFSHLEGAVIGEGADIGPYARLRPGSDIKADVKIGNFVEVKKSTLHQGAKVGHLTYLGDAIVGAKANIGAGTITCNYDGVNKHVTEIGAGAFIGSNSSLVAPVRIGDHAYTGSGSVITTDVPDGQLGVARGRQRNVERWKPPVKK